MSEELITFELNGKEVEAPRGAMLIDVTDKLGERVPRFCYHSKLSVAANCRMCLVEVEKAPKPLPACATPVNEGMKVWTQSPKAIAAQKSTMEFLLINHPLDCPICDQGGECELQDVAMGYGDDVSQYSERKRVVEDKNIGPLIATDMTRCIHCTRCVRFGEEVAGLRELGATGRGENMRIGTYVAKTVDSEMSGNVIDLCPVGALTAKPSRYTARAWEMVQNGTVAAHDCVGSNLYVHTMRGELVRAVPRDNESINECWISDRDRFSYEGASAADRATQPMIRRDGKLQAVSWDEALEYTAEQLKSFADDQIGGLVHSSSTLEEQYLFAKALRGLGSNNIDHRLRQTDFSDQDAAPLFPWLGTEIEALEDVDAALLIGADVRKDQPIVHHRLRKAAMKGATMMAINPRDFKFRFDLDTAIYAGVADTIAALAAVAKACGVSASGELAKLISSASETAESKRIAEQLNNADDSVVLLGLFAQNQPGFSAVRALASAIAEKTGASFGYLPEGANASGAWLAGCVPHRGVAGQSLEQSGKHAGDMMQDMKAYVLLNVEPENDCDNPAAYTTAMKNAFVVSINPFINSSAEQCADVVLPIGIFTETSGTFISAEGRWQSFNGVSSIPGEARPAWKVLRVLGNLLGLNGFDYISSEEVRDELKGQLTSVDFDNTVDNENLVVPAKTSGLMRIGSTGIYAVDALVRRAASLQSSLDGGQATVTLNESDANSLSVAEGDSVTVTQDGNSSTMTVTIDNTLPAGNVWILSGKPGTELLGSAFGTVELSKA